MQRSINLGVIGLGNRGASLVKIFREVHPGFKLAVVADPDEQGVRGRLDERGIGSDGTRYVADVEAMLAHTSGLDAILVGSRCDMHTLIAIKVAATGLPLYLEKPVSVSSEQLAALRDAYRGREGSVVVSFGLRATPLFQKFLDVVRSGRLGAINQLQAINNVPYGGVYYHRFYREHEISGGLWLQKATHDFDYINAVLGRPDMITAMMTRKVYGGDMPHDLWCSSCDRAGTCPESPQGVARRGDDGGMGTVDHLCAFGDGIKNQDAGSALIMYEGGVHASYTQNFVSRRSAATRGAIVTGYEATVSFDLFTGKVRVIEHHNDRVDDIEVKVAGGHHGGDHVLARNFVDVCMGRAESRSDLNDGLLSAAMCLAARESAHRQTWLPIPDVLSDDFPNTSEPAYTTPADLEPIAP
jgi:predicted dehydrogenase